MKKQDLIAAPLMVVCGLLTFGSPANAQPDDKACSDRTLQGSYGFAVEGVVLPAPGVALPIRGVHMTRFDGRGNLTQVDHILVNGTPPPIQWTAVTGTYHLNGDCTGTMHLTGSGGFVNLIIVVVRQGKEIRTVVTAPFDGPDRTVTSVGTKVD